MPNTSVPATAGGMPKIDRTDVMRAAWAIMRRSYTFGGEFVFGRAGRARFAAALRQAWADAKAALGLLTAEQSARRDRAEDIRQQLAAIEFKSWRFDYAGARQRLQAELASLAA